MPVTFATPPRQRALSGPAVPPPTAVFSRNRQRGSSPRQARGVATLLVVMALFFLVSMVAAYTSRNLIFEQRTSANQYRATQAIEAAEGGVEWALAKLNGGRLDTACNVTSLVGLDSFRQRYLAYDLDTGTASPRRWITPDGPAQLSPVCSLTATGWQCSCPRNGPPTLVAVDMKGVQPSFSVRFEGTSTPGFLRARVIGCTGPDAACLSSGQSSGDAVAGLVVGITQLPALSATPAAALTVRGDVQLASPATVINEDSATNGLAVHAAGDVPVNTFNTVGVAGSPASGGVVLRDASLQQGSAERFFVGFTGVSWRAFSEQPNVVRFLTRTEELNCASGCGDALRALIRANPWRPVYIDADVVLDSAGDVGSPQSPVFLVTTGKVEWASSGINVHGVIYAKDGLQAPLSATANWVQGAVISESAINTPTLPGIRFDPEVIQRIRQQQGSVIRLPGGWRDF